MVRSRSGPSRIWGTAASVGFALLLSAHHASAGPETALREFGSGQIKKGVRSIGMGGDGATWGNYALVYRDAGTALIDYGIARFVDTKSSFTFTAVGFTSPKFWDGAALYFIALAQHATDADVWSLTPASATKPPSIGDGSNQAVFFKLAKPLTETVSAGVMLAYEVSQMSLVPKSGGATIRFQTAWRPSGGAGVTWQPAPWLLTGVRVILNHDEETRSDGAGTKTGLLRSYEYRAGGAVLPWEGGILDAGISVTDRTNGLEGTAAVRKLEPTVGVEQAIVPKTFWLRAGLDETTWTTGASLRVAPLKLDFAYLRNLAAARTDDVFGHTNNAVIVTLNFDYERKP